MSKREFEMIPMSIGAQPAYGGGYNNCGSGWFGGGAGGAFAGGLAGGLLGDLFFGRRGYGGYGCYGDGGGYGHGGAGTVVQVNENDGRGRGGNISQWELMKEMSDTRREVAVMPYIAENTALEQTIAINQLMAGTNAHINGLQMQICQCCNESQRLELEGQYKMLLMQAGISREMSECCCKQLHATTVMGYETQLRDQAQFGAIMAEMKDIKCLVTDTAKATELREAYAKIAQLERVNLAQDIKETVTCGPRKVEIKEDFVRPLTPQYIPYYPARAVPQEDFSRGGCDNRWNFNNNGGFQ